MGNGAKWSTRDHDADQFLVRYDTAGTRDPANERLSFCITDIEYLVNLESDFPIIDVLLRATGSKAATCVLGAMLVVLLFFSTVTTTASASRQIWAFSRDQVREVVCLAET